MSLIGILGGTFDPVHYGHLRLAEDVREQWPCDRLLFIPAGVSPLKRDQLSTESHHRVEMLRLALAGRPDCEISIVDIDRQGPSFTVDTLTLLHQERPNDEFVLILGMDSFRTFPHWKAWETITHLAHLAVGVRPGEQPIDPLATLPFESPGSICYDQEKNAYRFRDGFSLRFFPTTPLDISATDLRRRAQAGRSLRYLTPDSVIEYLNRQSLYRK